MEFNQNLSDKSRKFTCDPCNYHTGNLYDYTKHCSTRKHNVSIGICSKTAKTPRILSCTPCDYHTCSPSEFEKHKTTRKHIKLNGEQPLSTEPISYTCTKCNIVYKDRSGLWRHNKNYNHTILDEISSTNNETLAPASSVETLSNYFVSTQPVQTHPAPTQPAPIQSVPIQSVQNISNEVIYELLKEIAISNQQNTEFKQMLIDQQSKIIELSSKTGNNNTINNHNTQINVNMFLNEYCKDAVTLTKFIESIKPSFEDVMYMSDKGNVAGLTKILKTALGGLAITDRPLHCTDVKRHTTWVKEADGWQKDQEQVNLKRLCNKVEHACLIKTMDIIQGDENYLIDGTAEYEHVHKMMLEAGGGAERHAHNIPIVVRNLEENIKLDKEQIQEAVKK